MKKIITLLLLLQFTLSFSQDLAKQLQGDWVKYKVEMKDGSRFNSQLHNENAYLKFTFSSNNLYLSSTPESISKKLPIHFSYENNKIKTSSTSGYLIEKLTIDSLIIVENYSSPDNKLIRYYCVNTNKYISDMKLTYKGKDTIIANRFYTPILKEPIKIEGPKKSLTLNGKIRIDIANKTINTIIESGDTLEKNYIKTVTKALNKSYNNWDLHNFEDFKIIEIPFYVRSLSLSGLYNHNISFILKPITSENKSLNQSESTKNYQQGLLAFKNSEFEKAINYFSEAYKFDNTNTEALYSRAAIYFHLGKKDEACADWKILNDLGQKRGIDFYNQYCNQ
jgi:tetratricopeptide (TPR) repeat protein